MPSTFDDSNIPWRRLDGFDDVAFFIYKCDAASGIVDIVYKFAPWTRQPLHRHTCPYFTLVLQGELRFYRPDGTLKEIRPTGSYVEGVVNGEPHFEGAGESEAIVFFGHRGVEDTIYLFLGADGGPDQPLGIADVQALYDAQVADGVLARVGARPA